MRGRGVPLVLGVTMALCAALLALPACGGKKEAAQATPAPRPDPRTLLNEAADRDVVVAFVGRPHCVDDRGSQVLRALKEIGYDQYYQPEQTGWVLYLEGSTDLAILQTFARTLNHAAQAPLERPFVHYVQNQPQQAYHHFFGLRAAKRDLVGFALFDRLAKPVEEKPSLKQHVWQRREIENYLCRPDVLLRWAEAHGGGAGSLWSASQQSAMRQCIEELESATRMLQKPCPCSADARVTDELLDPLFAKFFEACGLPNLMRKSDYHQLAAFLPPEEIDPEVIAVLDKICDTAAAASPRT